MQDILTCCFNLENAGKRTEKKRGLKYEIFNFNIYVSYQPEWLSDRPSIVLDETNG